MIVDDAGRFVFLVLLISLFSTACFAERNVEVTAVVGENLTEYSVIYTLYIKSTGNYYYPSSTTFGYIYNIPEDAQNLSVVDSNGNSVYYKLSDGVLEMRVFQDVTSSYFFNATFTSSSMPFFDGESYNVWTPWPMFLAVFSDTGEYTSYNFTRIVLPAGSSDASVDSKAVNYSSFSDCGGSVCVDFSVDDYNDYVYPAVTFSLPGKKMEMQNMTGAHFKASYPANLAGKMAYVSKDVDRVHSIIEGIYGKSAGEKWDIELVSVSESSSPAYYMPGTNEIKLRVDRLSKGCDFLGDLSHEIAHGFNDHFMGSYTPNWFNEGAAQVVENYARSELGCETLSVDETLLSECAGSSYAGMFDEWQSEVPEGLANEFCFIRHDITSVKYALSKELVTGFTGAYGKQFFKNITEESARNGFSFQHGSDADSLMLFLLFMSTGEDYGEELYADYAIREAHDWNSSFRQFENRSAELGVIMANGSGKDYSGAKAAMDEAKSMLFQGMFENSSEKSANSLALAVNAGYPSENKTENENENETISPIIEQFSYVVAVIIVLGIPSAVVIFVAVKIKNRFKNKRKK